MNRPQRRRVNQHQIGIMELKQLKEQRGEFIRQMNAIIATGESENRSLTEEETANFDKCENEIKALDSKIDTLERSERAKRLVHTETSAVSVASPYKAHVAPTAGDNELAFRGWSLYKVSPNKVTDSMKRAAEKVGLDFNAKELEFRAQTVGTANQGGNLTNSSIFQGLVEARKTYGGVRSVANVTQLGTGETRSWATYDGTSNKASIVGENTAISNVSRTFGTLPIAIYKYATAVYPVSHELLQDAHVDLASFFRRNLLVEVIRGQEEDWAIGSGSSEPYGVVTGASSALTAASTTTPTTDEIQDLIDSVDVEYHSNAVFMMHQTMLGRLRKLKDSNDLPVFLHDFINGRSKTLFGFPVVVNNWMEYGVGDKAILFGDFTGYQIVEAGSITVAAQEYPLDDYTAYVAKVRSGGRLLDAGAVKAITLAAA